ncbi:uncharacterized protein LOC135150927 [Daucus carota subsp. sativus]|uniref:uncharacterized protein LOC135150927 n=1 Tax=Daucus carota subsp. sativus TaxID=79200 RepID=UPI0030839B5D
MNVDCFRCGQKGHYSTECRVQNPGITCHKCGKVGHVANNCRSNIQTSVGGSSCQGPVNSTARARTFKMTKKSTPQDSDVVAGTLSLNFVPVKVLFDSGASKSFISKGCVSRMDLMLEDLPESLTIEVANQDKFSVSQFCPKCQLEILGHSFLADLIPFELGEFDVILGMDWLSLYKVKIDCKKKKVIIFTEDNEKVVFQGQRQEKKFLSIMQVKKLLRQGCEAYLAHVLDTKKETPKLEEIPVVRDVESPISDGPNRDERIG